jgi:hypothetical protein
MFETTGDQQSQSSVIVVSNNNVGNVVNGVVGGVDAHGAINALNDAIVDAITDQSHHLNHHLNNHSHINILSSYYYCKNLIDFPQFQSHHHHHHHVHYFNLNNNRFESASASSSSSATNQIKSSLVEPASPSPTTSVESSLDTNNNTTSSSLNDNCSFIIKDINNLINDAAHFGDATSKKSNLVLLKSSTGATSTPTQAENNDLISKINNNLSLSPFNSFQLSLTAISAEASTSPEQPKQHDDNKSSDSKTEAEAVEMQASSNFNNQISNTSNFDLVNDNIKLMEIVDNDASSHKTTTTTPIISNEKEMNKLCEFNSVSNSIKNYLLNESNSNNSISNTPTNANDSGLNCETNNNNISNKSMLDKKKLNKNKLIKMSNIPKRIGLRRNKTTVLFDSNSTCYNTRFKSRKFNSTLVNKRKNNKKIVNLVNNNNNNNSSTTTSRLANSNGIRTRSQTKLASQLLTQGSSTTPTASTNQIETTTETELSSPTKTKILKLKILNKRKRLRKSETNEPSPAIKLDNSKATPASANSNEQVDYETALNNRSTDKLYKQSSIIETNEHLVNKPGNVVFNQLTDVQNDSRCFYYKSDSNVKISYNTNASSNSVAQSQTNTLGSFANDFIYDQTAQMQLQHQQQQMQQMQPNESFASNQQQFIYDIEMMPQHQQFFIDDNRSSIYSFVSNCNNTSQIKQDLLKLSYDKFKQFRLNEKLLQQTVLIRNAIKMLQCDIKFQQEQEQIFLQQQQQQQMCLQQQQQQKMEYDNSISNRLSPHQNLGQTMYNSSQPSIITMASYDNLEDFLTRSEFVNNSMLNTNNFNISNNRNINSLNSTSNVNMNNTTNNAGLNESGVGVNNLSGYYSDLNNNNANINNNNQNEQEHQIQLYNQTINDNSTTSINKNTNIALSNGYETNIDVETEEDEEENEEEAEYEEEDDEEEEEDEDEEEDEPNEDEDDEDVDQESLNLENNNNTIFNKESNQNETNQIQKSEPIEQQYQSGSSQSQNTELTYFTPIDTAI